jgi:hypothetical protein
MSEITSPNTEVQVLPPVMDEDQVLNYTQQQRRFVIDKLTNNGAKLPDDVDQQRLMLQALDGMDRSALGRKKIKVEEQANQNVAGMTGIVAEMLKRSKDISFFQPGATNPGTTRAAPELGSDVPEPVLVEGELAQSPLQMSFDTFQSQFKSEDPTETS